MKPFSIHVKNKRVEYDLDIKNKFTFIRGISASGKTSMITLIKDFTKSAIGVDLSSDYPVYAKDIDYDYLSTHKSSLEGLAIFMDEDSCFVNEYRVASMDLKSEMSNTLLAIDSVFIFITRVNLITLPLSLQFVVHPVNINGVYYFKPIINKFDNTFISSRNYVTIIEDSRSGCEFISQYFKLPIKVKAEIHECKYNEEPFVTSSNGMSNLAECIDNLLNLGYKYINVIYDYVGAGFYGEDIHKPHRDKYLNYINWDSFEKYILDSIMFNDVDKTVNSSSLDVFNIEDYYEKLLHKHLPNYTKAYTKENCLNLKVNCYKCQHCKFRLNNRQDIFMHEPLVSKKNILN
jgi:hypothetical protein